MCVHVTQEATHSPNTTSCRCVSNVTRVLELYKEFQEEAYSVALHPSGLFMLVGFSDKLRLMNLLINDIRTFKEFTVRGCREVRCAGHVCWTRVLMVVLNSTLVTRPTVFPTPVCL